MSDDVHHATPASMFSGLSVKASGFFLLLSSPVSTPHSDSQVLVLFTLYAHGREICHCGKPRLSEGCGLSHGYAGIGERAGLGWCVTHKGTEDSHLTSLTSCAWILAV